MCGRLPIVKHLSLMCGLFVCCLSSDIVASDGSAVAHTHFPFTTFIKSLKHPRQTNCRASLAHAVTTTANYIQSRWVDAAAEKITGFTIYNIIGCLTTAFPPFLKPSAPYFVIVVFVPSASNLFFCPPWALEGQ